MSLYAFDDLLITCSEHISKHGFETDAIPPMIKGWLAEKIVSLLPNDLTKILLQNFLQNKENTNFQQSISMKTDISVEATKITLEIFRSPEMKLNYSSNFENHHSKPQNMFYLEGKSSIATNLDFYANELILENSVAPETIQTISAHTSQHLETHLSEPDFSDSDNSLSSPSKFKPSKIAKISKIITAPKPFKCHLCEKSYSHSKSHRNHQKLAHPEYWELTQKEAKLKPVPKSKERLENDFYDDLHECPLCEKTYKTSSDCKIHIKNSHPKEFEKAKLDSEKFGVKKSRGLPPQFSRIRCQVCAMTFGNLSKLNEHQETAHSSFYAVKVAAKLAKRELFTCNLCSKSFSEKKSLEYHMYSHTGGHPYKCDTCGAGFAFKRGLDRHVQSHTGNWACVCEICGKGFRDKDKLMEMHCKKHHVEFYDEWKRQKMDVQNRIDVLQENR